MGSAVQILFLFWFLYYQKENHRNLCTETWCISADSSVSILCSGCFRKHKLRLSPCSYHSRAFGALGEQEAWCPLGPPRSDWGWGWGAARLTQCVEVYTMAQLRGGWADSSIWPLPPASVPAGTEGAPEELLALFLLEGDTQWSCDKTGLEGEVELWKQDISKLEKDAEGL